MTGKSKPMPKKADGQADLLDDIERVLFKARAAQRPFVEYLLHMAFMAELEGAGPDKPSWPSVKAGARLH